MNVSFTSLIYLILMGKSCYSALPQGVNDPQSLGRPKAKITDAGRPNGHRLAGKELGKELFDWRRVHTK